MTSSMKQKRESGVLCTPLVRRSCHGRPVNTPPKKKLKPKTQSQWGQEYMTSFFNDPTTSLRTGRESGEEAAFSFRVTGFLQCGHFAIVCSPIFRRCVESRCVSPNVQAHRPPPSAGASLSGFVFMFSDSSRTAAAGGGSCAASGSAVFFSLF